MPQNLSSAKLEHHVELSPDHLFRPARLAIGQLLTDTQDRNQPFRMGRGELARHELIAFPIDEPALGVTDDHIPAADIFQHSG